MAQHHDDTKQPADHSYHSNQVAVCFGVTSEDRRNSSLTFGVDYERRIAERFGGEYESKVDRDEVAPQFDLDFVDNHPVFVPGFTIGRRY